MSAWDQAKADWTKLGTSIDAANVPPPASPTIDAAKLKADIGALIDAAIAGASSTPSTPAPPSTPTGSIGPAPAPSAALTDRIAYWNSLNGHDRQQADYLAQDAQVNAYVQANWNPALHGGQSYAQWLGHAVYAPY